MLISRANLLFAFYALEFERSNHERDGARLTEL
jgi:hypothetical protein